MIRTCGNCRGYVDGKCVEGYNTQPEQPACPDWDGNTHNECKHFVKDKWRMFHGDCQLTGERKHCLQVACERWVRR